MLDWLLEALIMPGHYVKTWDIEQTWRKDAGQSQPKPNAAKQGKWSSLLKLAFVAGSSYRAGRPAVRSAAQRGQGGRIRALLVYYVHWTCPCGPCWQ